MAVGARRAERLVLFAAIGLRIAVCVVLGPNGADNHYELVEHLLREHRLPRAPMYAQAYHPPAYTLLAVPFAWIGGPRAVEVLSLLLSITNLVLLFALLRRFVGDDRARLHAMLLLALLPEFIVFSILVSNDGLAMLAGTVAVVAALRFHRDPTLANAAAAALAAALGMLTKGTLLAHAAVLLLVVAVVAWRRLPPRPALARVALFVAFALPLGAYRYVDNQLQYGRLLVHNMDFGQPWVAAQRPTITSARSFVDVNLAKLLREPYAERRDGSWTNPRSVPLLLYATFWHPYVPTSNFRSTWGLTPVVAQLTYLVAIPATLLVVAGWFAGTRKDGAWIPLAFFVANLAIVLAAGIKYDAWSCFQSRLLFPSIVAIALGYAWGIAWARRAARIIDICACALYALFAAYAVIEIAQVVRKVLF